jgi:peptidoglycan/LPS O-acetylase OafA/YrhL
MVEKEHTFFNHLFIIGTLILNCLLYDKLSQKGVFVFIPLVYLIFYLFVFRYLYWMKSKVFLFLGSISYPLYLIHQNLGYTLIKQFELWGFTGFYVIVIVALVFIGLATLITVYLEKPLLGILRNDLEFKFKKKFQQDLQK